MNVLTTLVEEKRIKLSGGIYHKTQIELAYNSNRIEGSKLSEEQTRYIFDTKTVGFKGESALPIDDIIETKNHFVCFDKMLDDIGADLSVEVIKEFHKILKSGTTDASLDWFAVGEWKKRPNEVGGATTTLPDDVATAMDDLLEWYGEQEKTFEKIVEFHWRFEKVHPFQDGNGRVGRMIMLRECLKYGVVPFVIDDKHKQFYYRGLKEFDKTSGYLLDTCRSAQDVYKTWLDYFKIDY
jgi:Fic family protein